VLLFVAGGGWCRDSLFLEAGRRKKKEETSEPSRLSEIDRERGALSSFAFGIVILGSDFVPILGGRREGERRLGCFSSLLSSQLLLARLAVGSGLLTAIPALQSCHAPHEEHTIRVILQKDSFYWRAELVKEL